MNSDKLDCQITAVQELASAALLAVQAVPFAEVITRFVPSEETAANNARDADHVTDSQVFASDALAVLQLVPLVDVITRFVPVEATATNRANDGDHATDLH